MEVSFGVLLRQFRARAGLTVSELAELVGATRKSIAAWELDRRVPRDRARLDDLAQVLRLTTAEAGQLAAAARQHPSLQRGDRLPPTAGTDTLLPGVPSAGMALQYQLRPSLPDVIGRATEAGSGCRAAISGIRDISGIDKTELAYQVAQAVRATFPGAQIVVVYVEQVPYHSPLCKSCKRYARKL